MIAGGDDLSKMQFSELEKQKNTLRTLVVTWMVILTILIVTAVIVALRQGYSVFTVLPIVFLPGLIMSKRKLDMVKDELKRRNAIR